MKNEERVLLASDLHLCHKDPYGVPADVRMQYFVDDVKAEYEKDPFTALLLLGDYSLDFWQWGIKGSFLTEGLSNTAVFVRDYLSQLQKLPVKICMIAGNHEQYGPENWKRITGYTRQDVCVCGDFVFVLADTYADGFDPTEHGDGIYTGVADTAFLTRVADRYPDKKIILSAHYLDLHTKIEQTHTVLYDMIRSGRIVCAVAGHTHNCDIWTYPEYGDFHVLFTGTWFLNEKKPYDPMWGFREMRLTNDRIVSRYITPAHTVPKDGAPCLFPYATRDEIVIDLSGKEGKE